MKKMLIISVLITALICAGCKSTEATVNVSSTEQAVSSQIELSSIPTSGEVSSEVSSETPSWVSTSSKSVTSVPVSSAATSKAPKAESKVPVSSKAPTSSQSKPKSVSSQTAKGTSKPVTDDKPNFGDLMDEAVVDAIIAEGIEYANNKGMTWKDDYTVDGNGYYNPAFSGHGEEAFRRDLFYNIDQLYDLSTASERYVEGNYIYYKIVKGEFHEKGYWYGFVLY